jgi:hypothetical protein
MATQVGKFETHVGFKKDFELYVGPAQEVREYKRFSESLWVDVSRILNIPIGLHTIESSEVDGFSCWFENNDMSVSLYVGYPESDVIDKAPASLTAISRSDTVASWEIAEKLYTQLVSLGGYLVAAFTDDGIPIDSNFDTDSDW